MNPKTKLVKFVKVVTAIVWDEGYKAFKILDPNRCTTVRAATTKVTAAETALEAL